jgi:hypothetical protein
VLCVINRHYLLQCVYVDIRLSAVLFEGKSHCLQHCLGFTQHTAGGEVAASRRSRILYASLQVCNVTILPIPIPVAVNDTKDQRGPVSLVQTIFWSSITPIILQTALVRRRRYSSSNTMVEIQTPKPARRI